MVDLGTLPDWLMVVVTFAGFGGTLFLINHEIERRRSEKTQRTQDQAMKVGASTRTEERKALVTLMITNGSDAPIYGAMVVVHYFDEGREQTKKYDFDVVHPGTHDFVIGLYHVAVITNTIIEFTDASGHRWSRSSQGIFKDLGKPHG